MIDETEEYSPLASNKAREANKAMPDGYRLAPIDCVNGWNVLKGDEFLMIDGRIRRWKTRREAIEYAWQHAGLKLAASEHVPEFVYRKG